MYYAPSHDRMYVAMKSENLHLMISDHKWW